MFSTLTWNIELQTILSYFLTSAEAVHRDGDVCLFVFALVKLSFQQNREISTFLTIFDSSKDCRIGMVRRGGGIFAKHLSINLNCMF